ncbi:MAG: prenyltransferase [Candidatus Gastranaerophilaceae bacterium]
MFKKILFWLENSRIFTLPMSIFSWLVAFTFGVTNNGNIFYGILALIGICCCQLATNLFDDYIDFKKLTKLGTLKHQTKSKCAYITNGEATLGDILKVVVIYCLIACIIGAFLLYKTGYPVAIFAILGSIFVLSYAKWSTAGIGEIAVGLAFGPILFGGVYWVMTQSYQFDVFFIGTIIVMFTIGLLYTNSLLDYDGDKISHKKTLCSRFGDKNKAIFGLSIFYGTAYGLIIYAVVSGILQSIFLIIFFTIPLLLELIISLLMFNENKNYIPSKKIWHFPFERFEKIRAKDVSVASFRFRMYQARNLMIYASILVCIARIISIYF